MNHVPRTILQSLRAFVPARGLQHHEAQGIAERQATRLLSILDQHEPPVDVGLIAELPRMEVRVVRGRDLAGLSGMTQWLKKREPLADRGKQGRQSNEATVYLGSRVQAHNR